MKIGVIGPFPPPVHGSSKNLLSITNEIENKADVSRLSTSPTTLDRGLKYHSRKVSGVFSAMFNVLLRKFDKVYLTVDAGFGMYYTIMIALILRLKNVRVILHHRSFAYINKKKKAMTVLKYLTQSDCHVFLCVTMYEQYVEHYGELKDYLLVSNARQVNPQELVNHKGPGAHFTIGYISNLSIEKGFDVAVNVFNILKNEIVELRFLIAGPPSDSRSKILLEEVCNQNEGRAIYYGAVYEGDKDNFYDELDVLLFPTAYTNEAQPNVVFEAMAHGVIVISTKRGCISEDIGSDTGLVVDENLYIQEACSYIRTLSINSNMLFSTKQSTLKKIMLLKEKSIIGHNELISRIVANDK